MMITEQMFRQRQVGVGYTAGTGNEFDAFPT